MTFKYRWTCEECGKLTGTNNEHNQLCQFCPNRTPRSQKSINKGTKRRIALGLTGEELEQHKKKVQKDGDKEWLKTPEGKNNNHKLIQLTIHLKNSSLIFSIYYRSSDEASFK